MKTILITRPLDQAKPLAEKIQALGLRTTIFPGIEITAPEETNSLKYLSEKIDHFDIIIFISPTAVQFMQPWIKKKPRALLMTVGADTANAIKQQGWGDAIYPQAHFNREALLTLPQLQQLAQKNILICQGKDGNTILPETLVTRGAIVTLAECYVRKLPQPTTLPDLTQIDMVVCTSSASLENLLQLFGSAIRHQRLLVSSDRLRQRAEQLGFHHPPLLAKNAGDDAILQTLAQWLHEGNAHG